MSLNKVIVALLFLFALAFSQTVVYQYTKEQKASYASFAAYLTAVGSVKVSWEMGKDVAIAATTHIQSNLDIRVIMSGAKFTGASTLYIGKMSAKPEVQIFDTALTVFFDTGSVSEVFVHWFGNSKAAFRRANNAAALNGLSVVVNQYQYPIVGKITTSSSTDISRFVKGGRLKGNTGSATDTLIIGKMSAKPEYQVFDTSLVVKFNKNAVAYVDRKWFGSDARFNTAKDSINIWINVGLTGIDSLRGNTNIDSVSGKPIFTDTTTFIGTVLAGNPSNNTISNIILKSPSDGNYDYSGITFSGWTTPKAAIGFQRQALTYGRGDMIFMLDNAADANNVSITDEVVRITAVGNVGIGKTPIYKLDVSGRVNCDTLSTTYLARDTTFACSLFDDETYRATGTARAVIIGNIVTLKLPTLRGAITVSTNTYIHIPSKFRPSSDGNSGYITVPIIDNSVYKTGLLKPGDVGTHMFLKDEDLDYLPASADGGIQNCFITYHFN